MSGFHDTRHRWPDQPCKLLAIGAVLAAAAIGTPEGAGRHVVPAAFSQGSFIVAFELHAYARSEFVWPHPAFPAASYASVRLVVDEMPQGRARGSSGPFERLTAERHLRVNGRLQNAERIVAGARPRDRRGAGDPVGEQFTVELEAGRLRLSLVLPPAIEIEARHQRAHITLYEVDPRRVRSPGLD